MYAMVLNHPAPIDSSPLRWTEVPDPMPAAREVRVKAKCCAMCRTDLHVIEGDLPQQRMPIIPGHQVVGVVDQLGPDCRRFGLGQRIGIAWLRGTDGTCEYCRTGRENLCPNTRFTGYHADGGYAQYAVVPEDFAYEIPDEFGDVEATPLLCAGIIGYRSLKRANPHSNCRVALYGFGSSAHIVMQLALHRGYEIYVVTRGENHRTLAKQMGATWVGESSAQLPAKVDCGILFAPVGTLVPAALEQLKPGGTLSLAGIYMTDIPTLNYEKHLFYERNLHSVTCNTRDDGHELLAEAAAAHVKPHTTQYDLRDANRALQDLRHDRISGTGVLMIPQ